MMYKKPKITCRAKYGYNIFDIIGEIEFSSIKEIEEYINNNISEKYPVVILNLKEVPYINSSALAFLVEIMEKFLKKSINMKLMNLNENINGLMETTGVKRYFNIIKNEGELTKNLKNEELDQLLDIPEE